LVVDDSRLSRKMLVKLLAAAKHTCEEAEDGLEAVEKVKRGERQFDCILMDFVMPNMDGPTATKEIRALGFAAPIFGVTGNALDFDIEHFLRCGATKVFPKPFDMEKFNEAMGIGR
jgi:CheY-like chemotaxis protein